MSVALLLVSGCKKEPPASAGETAPGAPAQPSGKHFTVAFTASEARVAQPLELKLTLTATDGFHVNGDYPASFKPEPVEGVSFEHPRYDVKAIATRVPCERNADDACALEAKLGARAEQPGKKTVSGVFAFSVCNPDQCLIEKQPVSVELDVLAAANP